MRDNTGYGRGILTSKGTMVKIIMSQKFRAPMPRSERRRYSGGGTTSAAGAVTGEMLGDGHTHRNISLLEQLSKIDEGYLYYQETTYAEQTTTDEETGETTTEMVKTDVDYKLNAGLADVAKDLTEDSKVWEIVLRKDKEDELSRGLQQRTEDWRCHHLMGQREWRTEGVEVDV